VSNNEKFSALLGYENEARCDAWEFGSDDFFLEYASCLDIEEFELNFRIGFPDTTEAG